jgi:hypothetical protein
MPMTPAQRNRAFVAARGRIVRAQTTHLSGTRDELARLLKEALGAIAAQLAAQPSDYERWSLPQLGAEVRRALNEFGERGAARASTAIGRAWQLGEDLVDAPLEAGGVRVAAVLPRIDTRALQAMRAFTVDRIRDIGLEAANKITAELGLVVIGARAPSDAIGAVSEILGAQSRERATTIVRTELGSAFSHATQLRMEGAAELLPGLQKQWRRSGKRHPRLHHDLADGQVVDVDKPFILKPLGRSPVELMYPRDPKAPVGERVNCGCQSIPFMAHWNVKHRGRTPGSPLLEDDGDTLADVLARVPARQPA